MEMVTTKQLSEFLSISELSLFNMRKNGTGPPYYRIKRGIIRYNLKEVLAWLEELKKV